MQPEEAKWLTVAFLPQLKNHSFTYNRQTKIITLPNPCFGFINASAWCKTKLIISPNGHFQLCQRQDRGIQQSNHIELNPWPILSVITHLSPLSRHDLLQKQQAPSSNQTKKLRFYPDNSCTGSQKAASESFLVKLLKRYSSVAHYCLQEVYKHGIILNKFTPTTFFCPQTYRQSFQLLTTL